MITKISKKFVSPNKAVEIIRSKQDHHFFGLKDLSRLVKHGELNLYVEFLNPEPYSMLCGVEGLFDLPDEKHPEKEFVYKKIKERAIRNPVETDIYLSNAEDYNFETSVDDILMEKGFFKYYAEGNLDQPLTMPYEAYSIAYREYDNAWWLFNTKQLQAYLKNKKPKIIKKTKAENLNVEPDWDTLEKGLTGNRGKLLVYAWKQLWVSEKKYIPNVLELIEWLVGCEESFLAYFEIEKDPEGLLIRSSHGKTFKKKLWKDDKIEESLNKIIERYKEQLAK